MRPAVVGHVEWVTFARVARVPTAGEIVHATHVFDVPAGGGAVAAVQLLKLAGTCTFFTALGDDAYGHRAKDELEAMGLRVEAVFHETPQRRAFTYLDATGERTITVMGSRLGPQASDPLPWDDLHDTDAVYFTAGDDDALRLARRARTLVATSREHERLARAGVRLDAVVGSSSDPAEPYQRGDVDPVPGLAVRTAGADGGRFETASGESGTFPATPVPGPIEDAYGCGDSFAGGLTFAVGSGMKTRDALALAARCGAACLTGRGPYAGQLTG